mgnify:CR=1 FL=1
MPLGAKLASKSGQIGVKIGIQLDSNFKLVSEEFVDPLGDNFGCLFRSKIGSESVPNIRCLKY